MVKQEFPRREANTYTSAAEIRQKTIPVLVEEGRSCLRLSLRRACQKRTESAINNTTVPVWFEAGRHEIFKLFTPDLSFKRWRMVIIRMEVDYVNQLYYGQDVTVYTGIGRIGNTSLTIYEEIHQNGVVCAKGRAVYVNFNFDTGRPEPIPDDIGAKLREHVWQPGE
ncbi:thioesterase family protein [Geobacillus stearothermophilus]|nr:thioesterase family protein [Geobacillus stearothermophilus]MED3747711.1 thioesterase family protein [Geobacillus stearothermophilus]MED3768605.1 thioesterase family protein [Geobacillus stearothermophilus]MED3771660.1 thioesterase family protein [Geobacillus stearothermophilus]